ncbi:MAG: YafY family transcriptional regulator [Actinobacteria bacterium]|nr:YafY family transcriptional regulator [Actinomycetota bacterium]
MESAERLLKLLGLLEGRIDWTAEELARRLEVTTRTIRRDITRLRELGYLVEAVAGRGGGYRLGAGGKLPPLLLDDDEAVAVALGLRLTSAAVVGGLEESSISAMTKLEHVLPGRLRERLEDIAQATVTVPGVRATRIDPQTLAVTSAATRARQRIRFSYIDGQGRASERHVEPLRLVHTGRRWYLAAFDIDRDDWRTFRLDRVSSAKATGMKSTRRQNPDPVELVTRGIAVDVWVHRAVIELGVPLEVAARHVPRTVGTLESIDDGSSRLVIGADELDWLARFLLNLGLPFNVVEPEELRSELATVGRTLVATYG